MGRRRLYFTDAERQAANRAYNRKYRAKLLGALLKSERQPHARHPDDLYETPVEVIEACLAMVDGEDVDSVLDVGAHDGRWGLAARGRWPEALIDGVELRETDRQPGFARWFVGDFLEGAKWLSSYDLVIGNPPYEHAEEFVRAALGLLWDGGQLLFLLQSQFLHGKGRKEGLFAEFPVKRIYPLGKRVAYHSGQGGTRDATAFLWEKGWKGTTEVYRGTY